MWDRLRLVAFADVVSIHVAADYIALGVGLPLFLTLRFALGSRHTVPQSFSEFWRVQFKRLLIPWVAWSILLGGLRLVSSLRHGIPLNEAFSPYMLVYGTERYLWFLPFAAIAGVITHFLDRATQRARTEWLVAGCVLIGGLLLMFCETWQLPRPFGKWMFGAPAIFLGLAVGRILARPEVNVRRVWICLLAVSVIAILYFCRAGLSGEPIPLIPPLRYAMAMALLGIGVLLPKFEDPWTPRLAPLLLGGYLLHDVAFYQVIYRLANATHFTMGITFRTLATVGLVLIVVSVMRRTRLRAIL